MQCESSPENDKQMSSDDAASASTDASPSASTSDQAESTPPLTLGAQTKNKFKPIALPNAEQMMMEEIMNNCFVKTGVSTVMGGLAGVAFGLFSASMENAHGVSEATWASM